MDQIQNAVQALQLEAAGYPEAVQVWMRTMAISFFAGTIFAWNKLGARLVVGTMLLTFAGLVVGKIVFPDASRSMIGSVVHVSLWVPLLWWLWRTTRNNSTTSGVWQRIYTAWIGWVSLLIVVSLTLDFKHIITTVMHLLQR